MAAYQEYLEILEVEPTDIEALTALEELASSGNGAGGLREGGAREAMEAARQAHHERGELDLVRKLYDVELAAATEPGARADLLLAKGQFLQEELFDEDAALECYFEVLDIRPDDPDAQGLVGNAELVAENWPRIVDKYLSEADRQSDRALITSLYLSAAGTCVRYQPADDTTHDVEKYLRRALEVDPRNRKAAYHLEALLGRAERWQDLAAYHEQRASAGIGKAAQVQELAALARLADTQLGDAELVRRTMQRLFDLEPAHRAALSYLIETLTAAEDWSALSGVLGQALAAGRASSRRKSSRDLSLLLLAGDVTWKRVGDTAAAQDFYRRARKLSPAHPEVLAFYRAYHGERGEPERLLQVLQQAMRAAADPDTKRALSVELAQLAESAVGNPEKAIDAWKQVLRRSSDDEEKEQARQSLKGLYETTEKWNALLELLKEELELAPDDKGGLDTRVELLGDMVAIYRDHLKLDVMVVNTYRKILELDPGHRAALDALARKFEELGRHKELVDVLTRKAALPGLGDAERAELLGHVATLWIERFSNPAQAVAPLQELLVLRPRDAEAGARLEEIYTRRRQWQPLLELKEKQLALVPEDERTGALVVMARLAAERLGDTSAAIRWWSEVLASEPEHGDALRAVAALHEREKNWGELVSSLDRLAATSSEGAVGHLERMATIQAERLDEPSAAAATYRRILALDPDNGRALRMLRDLFMRSRDVDALVELFADRGAWRELLDVLHQLADRMQDDSERVSLLLRTAELARERAGEPTKAAKAYERILAIDPGHGEAARQLVPLYRAAGKWARLLSAYESLLTDVDDPDERVRLHVEVRELCEEHLGSKALAFQWAASAYELRPEDPELLRDMLRLGADADAWDRVAALIGGRLEEPAIGEDEKERLLRELGRVRAHRLHQPEAARAAWEDVLALLPDDTEAMAALEELAAQSERWDDLLKIQRRRAELETDETARIELLYKIAFIAEERARDPEAAARSYEAILDLDPDASRALRQLTRIHTARGDGAGLARVYERELALGPDADKRVELLLKLGQLYEGELGEPSVARQRYEAALEMAPMNRQVHAALERYLAAGSSARAHVAGLLVPVYERLEDHARLARALAIVREHEGDAVTQAELDRRLVALYGKRLGERALAFEAGVRLLHLVPDDAANRQTLLRLAAELERTEELAEHLSEVTRPRDVEVLGDEARAEVAAELARLAEELGQFDRAVTSWRMVLDVTPGDAEAFAALERILRGQQQYGEVHAVLEAWLDQTVSEGERKRLLERVCDVTDELLDDPSAAMHAYERLLELDPTVHRGYKALERLYAGAGKWSELEAVLTRARVHADEAAEVTRLIVRRAEVHAVHLHDSETAVDLAEEALARDPGNDGARALLETCAGEPALELRIARLLAPVYEAKSEHKRLVRVLRTEVDCLVREHGQGPDTAALLARMARVADDKLADEKLAFAVWSEAVVTEPGNATWRQALEALADRTGKWSAAAQVWEQAAREAPDVVVRATLLAELGAIFDERLGNAGQAAGVYRQLLDAEADPELTTLAIDALVRLHSAAEAWDDVVDMERHRIEWATDPAERIAALARVAAIHEDRRQDLPAATAAWREVLAEDPGEPRALDELERLFSVIEDAASLVEILRRRVEMADDRARRRDLLLRIATLQEEAQDDAAEAVATYLEIMDLVPHDEVVLAELARMYRVQQRWLDLVEVNERRLELADEAEPRTLLLLEQASLLGGELERPEEALERYREILVVNEAVLYGQADAEGAHRAAVEGALLQLERTLETPELELRAIEALRPVYQRGGEHEKYVGLLEREVRLLEGPRERLGRLEAIARLCEVELGDTVRAFDALVRASREAAGGPELASLVPEIERLARQSGRLADVAVLYRELGPDVMDQRLRLRMHLEAGRLARDVMADPELAIEQFRLAREVEPEDATAPSALETLYREGGLHAELRELLEERLDRLEVGDADRRLALVDIARLCETQLDDVSAAMAAWEQVRAEHPGDDEAALALDALYARTGRHVELVELLEERTTSGTRDRAGLQFRIAELCRDELGDAERALGAYGRALAIDPEHEGAVAGAEACLSDPALRLRAAEILEPIYIAHQVWPKLIRITEIRLDAEHEPAHRLELTRRIATLCEEQLEDLPAAFHWYGKVFREAPYAEDQRAAREQLVRLATLLENWEELARVYQEHVDESSDPVSTGPTEPDSPEALTADVARGLATVYDRRLGDVERARTAYLRVLRIEPSDDETFSRLEAMLEGAERWYALIELYDEGLDTARSDARRKDLLGRRARVQEQHLDDVEHAVDSYRAILDIDPEDDVTIAELDRLYRKQERWHDLVELLARGIERAGDSSQAMSLRLRMAELLREHLDDVHGAIDQYEQVLRVDDTSSGALLALEKLVLGHEHRGRIAELLEPIYRRHDWWQKLVIILDARLELVNDPVTEGELLEEIARIHESRGGDMGLALGALGRAFALDPARIDVREELDRVADKLGAHAELVRILEQSAADVVDPDTAASILGRAATVREEFLRDEEGAIASWRRVLGLVADDTEALVALDRLYSAAGNHEELARVLGQRANLPGTDVMARKELLYRRADVQEVQLGRLEQSIATWREVQALDDEDPAALDALGRLYGETEDWRSLLEIVARKLELCTEDEQRVALHRKAALVAADKLDDRFEAVSQLRALLALSPGDPDALARLETLLAADRAWPDLVEVLDRRAELAQDPTERLALRYRAARVVEREELEPMQAIERYRGILEADPEHEETLAALDTLAQEPETLGPAGQALERVYRAGGRWDRVAELYERRLAEIGTDPDTRRADHAALARVHEEGRGDHDAAFGVWGRLLVEEPHDELARQELERLAETGPRWQSLATLYEKVLADITDAELGRAHAMKLAEVHENGLGDLESAARFYLVALDFGGDDKGPLAALDLIHERQGNWHELASVLSREAHSTDDPAEQAAFFYRLGDIRERELADMHGALEAYREVTERAPEHEATRSALDRLTGHPDAGPAAIAILESLYDNLNDWPRLADLMEVKLARETSTTERAILLSRLAELAEKRLGNQVRALDAAGRWLNEEPTSGRALDELERLATELGRFEELAACLSDVVQAAPAPDITSELSMRLGGVLLNRIEDPGRAETAYQRVLSIEPRHPQAILALERIYRRVGDTARLCDIVWQRAEEELDASRRRELYAECAQLREDALGDTEGAIDAYRRILEVEEGDQETILRLAALYEAQSRFSDLVELMETAARFAPTPAAEAGVRKKIARLHGERLGNPERALDAWTQVIDLVPTDDSALVALATLHREREDWLSLQEVLVRRLGLAADEGDTERRIVITEELALVAENEREAPEDAIAYWQDVLELDPAHSRAFEASRRLLAETGRWVDLVQLLEGRADVPSLLAAADILQDKLDSPTDAVTLLERVSSERPDDVSVLARMARMYESLEDFEAQKRVIASALALGATGTQAADLAYQMSRAARQQDGDPEAARAHLERALAEAPGHLPSLRALEEMARDADDTNELMRLLALRAPLEAEPERRTEAALELHRLHARTGQGDQALPVLEDALSHAPTDARLLEAIADLYAAAGRRDDAAPIYADLAASARSARRMKDVARLRGRQGALLEASGDREAALSAYEEAYRVDPTAGAVMAGLGRLYFLSEDWGKARRIYRGMLLQNLDDSAQITKPDVYLQLGRIHEKLDEPRKARGMFERGLELAPDHDGLKLALADGDQSG